MFMMMMNSTYGVVPGIALITMAFAIAYVGDGAAYFGGRAMGKHKLARTSAPKRRWKARFSAWLAAQSAA